MYAIDHTLIPSEYFDIVERSYVLDDHAFNVSDHHPVIAKLRIDKTNYVPGVSQINRSNKISWEKARRLNCLNDYSFAVSQHLLSIKVSNVGCTDIES